MCIYIYHLYPLISHPFPSIIRYPGILSIFGIHLLVHLSRLPRENCWGMPFTHCFGKRVPASLVARLAVRFLSVAGLGIFRSHASIDSYKVEL